MQVKRMLQRQDAPMARYIGAYIRGIMKSEIVAKAYLTQRVPPQLQNQVYEEAHRIIKEAG